MTWPVVARGYMDSFLTARAFSARAKRPDVPCEDVASASSTSPVDSSHVRLDDDTGIFQHATFNVPRRLDGYCPTTTRALLTTMLEDAVPARWSERSRPYPAFVDHAPEEETDASATS
jgi:hypothetical protein